MATQEEISSSVEEWAKRSYLDRRTVCHILNLSPSALSRRMTSQRRWTVDDLDRLVELGVIEPISDCSATYTGPLSPIRRWERERQARKSEYEARLQSLKEVSE